MYAISKNIRKYSPTPVVEIVKGEDGKEDERIVFISVLKKKEGDELSAKLVGLLNKK